MFLTIVKKEILENLLTMKFTLFALFCVILIPSSFYFNYKSYQTRLNDYREIVRLHQDKLATVYARDYSEKMKGFRAPSPLMVFTRGLEDVLPQWATATRLGPVWGNSALNQEAIQVLIENVDFHFIVKFIFSLVALLFSFHLICGEKESGALRQMLANSVPRHVLLLGKICGSYFVLLIPFIISFIIGLILLSFLTPELISSLNLLRIIFILLTALLFISVFFMLGLLISSRARNTITALVSLLFIWILIVFIIPGMTGIFAKIINPVKTEPVLNLEKELIQKQINKEKSMALKSFYDELSNDSGDGTFDQRFEKYIISRKPIALNFEEQERQAIAKLDRDFWRDRENQEKLTTLFSKVSPAPVLSYAMTNLSNTGLTYKHAYYSAVINYNSLMNDVVLSKIWRDEYILGEDSRASQGGFYDLPPKDVSPFRFQAPDFLRSLTHAGVDILLLIIYNLLFFIGSYASFLRYDVR